jgi:hypothetical protein
MSTLVPGEGIKRLVLTFFLFNFLSFIVTGYLRVGICCPHLSMYSFCSVCEDVGVSVVFLFDSLSFTVAGGYLRVLGFCCPHLSMYSFCSVCKDVGVSVFLFNSLSLTVAGYLQLCFCCPHLSMYSFSG